MQLFEEQDKKVNELLERRRQAHRERIPNILKASPKQEPSSTVQSPGRPVSPPPLPSPPISRRRHTPSAWKGFIDVPEVCKFFTTAHGVHGNSETLKSVSSHLHFIKHGVVLHIPTHFLYSCTLIIG